MWLWLWLFDWGGLVPGRRLSGSWAAAAPVGGEWALPAAAGSWANRAGGV